jgi:UDP-perosamine 4-acetyltransferase
MRDPQPGVRLCVVLGGGGHARVVLDALRAGRAAESYVVLDSDPARIGGTLDGVPIAGSDDRLIEYAKQEHVAFVVGIGGAGDTRARRRLFELARSHGMVALTCVHPAAVCSPRATVAPGAQLLAGSIVGPGAVIGLNAIVNSGAIVEHDCRIGDHVHVAIGARLSGGVSVGANAHIGAGATILEGTLVGAGSVVGAGAAVISDVPENVIVAGVPARVLRAVDGGGRAEGGER